MRLGNHCQGFIQAPTPLYETLIVHTVKPAQRSTKLVPFPDLSRFGSSRVGKMGKAGNTYHMNDVRWMQGGRRGRVCSVCYTECKPKNKNRGGQGMTLL